MQHPPTLPYQDSSDCEKRGYLLVTVVQFTLCFRTAFAFELLFPSFIFIRFLPSKGLRFALPSKSLCLCHRRVFAVKVPFHLPSKGLCVQGTHAFAMEGLLPSNGFCLQSALAFAIERPLPSKYLAFGMDRKRLCRRRAFAIATDRKALAFGIEGPWSSKGPCLCHRRAFIIEAPLAWKRFCRRRVLAFAIEGPFP